MNPETNPPNAQSLPAWNCCGCGTFIHTDAPSRRAIGYEDCLRRCDRCGIGISNARSNPTLIYREPEQNVPEQVRDGLRETASHALNVRNRESKWPRIGYSTSEDALTWTVFTHLHRSDELGPLFMKWVNEAAVPTPPTLLLWGVPQPPDLPRGADLRRHLASICDSLGEGKNSRSEPDVILDFGPAGVIVIEVKYRSANSTKSRKILFDRYLADTEAFLCGKTVKQSGLYELARNWRIGTALAGIRPFTLLNLVVTDSTPELTEPFSRGLNRNADRRFEILPWRDLLSKIQHRPAWFEEYLNRFPQLAERVDYPGARQNGNSGSRK